MSTSEDRPTSADTTDELEEIFVSITGQTTVTLPQNQGPGRGVIDAARSEPPPRTGNDGMALPRGALPGTLATNSESETDCRRVFTALR